MEKMRISLFCVIIGILSALSSDIFEKDTLIFTGHQIINVNQSKLSLINPSIKHLILKDNIIKKIKSNSFEGFYRLESLEIEGNELLNLQPGAFEGLNTLEKMWIKNETRLMTLRPDSFKGLGNLKHLDLINNHIAHLHHRAFNGLENLQSLNIYGNNLNDLRPGIFGELKKLDKLNIDNEKNITTLHKGVFYGLESLTKLSISQNGLTDLEPGAFDGLRKLDFVERTRIFLGREEKTRGKSLPANKVVLESDPVFDGTNRKNKNYFDMHLDGNEIAIIKNRTFDGAFITELNLHNNKIAKIIPGAFFGLTVWNLNMSDNQLTTIEPGTFNGILDIRGLDLSKNKLTCLTPQTFAGLINFAYPHFVLHLENNLITTIEDFTFKGFVFQSLDLHGNRIGRNRLGNFSGLSVGKLDLSENEINLNSEWLIDEFPKFETLVFAKREQRISYT